jgi:hypothetical protein
MGLDDDDKIHLRSSKHNWDVGVAKSVCSTPPGNAVSNSATFRICETADYKTVISVCSTGHFAILSPSLNKPLSPPPPLRQSHSASVA